MPVGATTGPISITTPLGTTTSAVPFTVLPERVGGAGISITSRDNVHELTWGSGTLQLAYYVFRLDVLQGQVQTIGPLPSDSQVYRATAVQPGTLACYALAAVADASLLRLSDMVCGLTGIDPGPYHKLKPQQVCLATSGLGAEGEPVAVSWIPNQTLRHFLGIIPLDGSAPSFQPAPTLYVTQTPPVGGSCYVALGVFEVAAASSDAVCMVPGIATAGATSLAGAQAAIEQVAMSFRSEASNLTLARLRA